MSLGPYQPTVLDGTSAVNVASGRAFILGKLINGSGSVCTATIIGATDQSGTAKNIVIIVPANTVLDLDIRLSQGSTVTASVDDVLTVCWRAGKN